MQHLLAFSSQPGNVTVYTQINAVADQLYTRQNNEFQIPKRCWVPWYAGGLANATAMRIFTASLRLRGNPQVMPIGVATFNTRSPQYVDLTEDPLMLVEEENLRVEAIHPNAGADIARCFISVDQLKPNFNINYRQGRWVRATTSITTVAEGWSNLGALTLDDVVEGGSYACYGLICMEPTVLAGRLVFQNQHERPGTLGILALADDSMFAMKNTNLGLMGVFDTYSLPQFEGFANAAATVTVNLWLFIAKADGFQPPFRGQQGY